MTDCLHVTAHTTPAIFDQLGDAWNALLHRSATDVVFLTREWQSTWWEAYQAGDLWVLECRDGAGTLVGIAPWFVQQRDGERIVRTIGCVDVTDYVDVIADRERIGEVLTTLAMYLADRAEQYDRINLCNIPESSPTYQVFPDQLRQRGFDADMVFQEVCPVVHLPDGWEEYLAMLDKKQRHEIRRKLRKAESEARLEYYCVGPEHDFSTEIDRFFQLMASSQPAKAEFLSDARNAAFFRRALEVTQACGWLKLSFLKVDGVYAAAYCDFDYNRQTLVYNSGLLLDDRLGALSPGIVLLSYNIQRAIAAGHTLFDFLRGNETYKYRMGAQDTRVYKLVARRGRGSSPEAE